MNKLVIKNYIRYIFLLAFMGFLFNKFYLRPWVLKNDYPFFFDIVVYSFPNFVEAVMGTTLLVGIILQLKIHFYKQIGKIKDSSFYLIATIAAGFYVISQELRFHNLGGNNTYDPYDLLASIIGLVFINLIINKYGFLS